mgnify:CR=1 FL=1
MVGIFSIGGGPVRANDVEQSQARGPRENPPVVKKAEVKGNDALSASEAARYANIVSASENEVDEARVEQARRNIEEGIYRIQEVVQIVAARISKYIELQ